MSKYRRVRFLETQAVKTLQLLWKLNTERISMKFALGYHYHEQIKWLHFGQNLNRNK